jgi:hypothetical protein
MPAPLTAAILSRTAVTRSTPAAVIASAARFTIPPFTRSRSITVRICLRRLSCPLGNEVEIQDQILFGLSIVVGHLYSCLRKCRPPFQLFAELEA